MHVVESKVIERSAPRVAPDESAKIAALLQRAALLPPEDRLLIELLQRNATRRQIADILKAPPGTVCRRIQRLSRRLHNPIVIALLDERCPLEASVRQIGVERLLLDHSLGALSTKHQRHTSEIRRILEFIRGWHAGVVEGFQWAAHARSPR
jgi:hypothetical protein